MLGFQNYGTLQIAPALSGELRAGAPRKNFALLINPFYPKDRHASFGKHVLTPTQALTSIAGATPKHWQVRYWDENLLQGPPPDNPIPHVVGITVHLTFSRRAYELAAWYRQRGSIIVLGGLHVISCPDEAGQHADILAIGEGVQIWPQILADIERGDFAKVYRGSFSAPYRDNPPPRRNILDRRSFLTTASLIATRGCHNRCGFCYLSTDGLQMPYRMKDVEQIAAEIREDRQPYAVFIDNNLGSRKDYLLRLCLELRSLEIIWSAAVTVDVADDPQLVREMALAGCTGVFVGLESINNRNIAAANKKSPHTNDYSRRIKIFHDSGIQVNGSFVLGFDNDRPDCFEKTVEWIEANRLECATFHILTPYPGTPLFAQLQFENRILHHDWEKYDTAHVVFRPRNMSPDELQQGYIWCYKTLFSPASIWRRRPAEWHAVPAYLGMSYLYKKSNWLWPLLIKHRLTAQVWRPLVEISRRRHLRFRKKLMQQSAAKSNSAPGNIVSAGV